MKVNGRNAKIWFVKIGDHHICADLRNYRKIDNSDCRYLIWKDNDTNSQLELGNASFASLPRCCEAYYEVCDLVNSKSKFIFTWRAKKLKTKTVQISTRLLADLLKAEN